MTEVRVAINTHTPRALPPPEPVNHSKPLHQNNENQTREALPTEKRKIEYGPPALTRKDFILAWSIDMAAFRARQKEITLEQRRARRMAREDSERATVQSDNSHNELQEVRDDNSKQLAQKDDTGSSAVTYGEESDLSSSTYTSTSLLQKPLSNSNTTSDSHHTSLEQANEEKGETVPTKSTTTRKRRLGGDGLSLQHVRVASRISSHPLMLFLLLIPSS